MLAGAVAGMSTLAAGVALLFRQWLARAATTNSREVYDLTPDWRLIRKDVPGASAASFDDSACPVVSLPHTYTDVDSFDNWITSTQVLPRPNFTLPLYVNLRATHRGQMLEVRKAGGPNGKPAMARRSISDNATYGGIDVAEYAGAILNRHYSGHARDHKPFIDKYTYHEAKRRVWEN